MAKPLFCNILVEVEQPKEYNTDGLIHIPKEFQDKIEAYAMTGIIREIGDSAYKNHPSIDENSSLPKIGDRVCFQRYVGVDKVINDTRYKILRDDCLLLVLDPEDTVE